jgi:probable RNA-binding protein EIF1AD
MSTHTNTQRNTMVRPRRIVQAAAEESTTPPEALTATQQIARVVRAAGNNLYLCSLAGGRELLVELAPRFRSTLWMRRGGYVLVDTAPGAARDNKIGGVVENVVRDEKRWRKCAYW